MASATANPAPVGLTQEVEPMLAHLALELTRSGLERVSIGQACDYLHAGRISQRQYDIYWLFWAWSAPRYTGPAAELQRRYITHRGGEALRTRFDRFCGALKI